MSTAAWLVFAFVAVPVVGVLVWMLFDDSFVRIPSGRLGLLVIKGRATDQVLLPGPHWVPALRRRSVQEYPSLEMSYRAGAANDEDASDGDLEQVGPSVRAVLGDRIAARVSYTLRFRLVPEHLRAVHERFGSGGIWIAVRDITDTAVRDALNDPGVSVDSLFGPARHELAETLSTRVGESLTAAGFALSLFSLTDADLGATGEVVQSTVRSRLELEREAAEATVRLARARNDSDLLPFVNGAASEFALRYRESEVWRDLVNNLVGRVAVPPSPARAAGGHSVVLSTDDSGTDESSSGDAS